MKRGPTYVTLTKSVALPTRESSIFYFFFLCIVGGLLGHTRSCTCGGENSGSAGSWGAGLPVPVHLCKRGPRARRLRFALRRQWGCCTRCMLVQKCQNVEQNF